MEKLKAMHPDLTRLFARLIIGGIFVTTGWMKVSDMTTTLGFFGTMHIPTFLTYIVSYVELIGGILVVLGLYAEYAAGFLVLVMAGALYFTIPMGFQVFMTPLATLGGLVAIHGTGSGKFAIKPSKM